MCPLTLHRQPITDRHLITVAGFAQLLAPAGADDSAVVPLWMQAGTQRQFGRGEAAERVLYADVFRTRERRQPFEQFLSCMCIC